jgi:hypothetical protein
MFKVLRNLLGELSSQDVIQKREAHYEKYFGCAPKIYHSTNEVFPHIDIYHFEPAGERAFHTLITGGMADYRQPKNGSAPRRVELMLYVAEFQWWAANLLKLVAEYPAENQTFFAAYHTIPMGSALTSSSEISAFLLVPPSAEDFSRLSFSVGGDQVEYLACIPITNTEHIFAQEVGSQQLHEKLKESNLLIHRDDNRKSILDYKSLIEIFPCWI